MTVQTLYGHLMDTCDANLIMDQPMIAITDCAFEMTNDWLIADNSFEFLHGGSVQNGDDLYVGMVAIFANDEPTPTGIQQDNGPVQPLNMEGDVVKIHPSTEEISFVNLRLNQRYFKPNWVPTSGNFVYPALDMWDPYPLEETLDHVLEGQKRRIEQLGEV